MTNHYLDDEEEFGYGGESEATHALGLSRWLEEAYAGDHRFAGVESDEPGAIDGEAVRVRFVVNDRSSFFAAIDPEEGFVRVGLTANDEAIGRTIEEALDEEGLTATEFVAQAAGTEDELEYEVQQFEDDTITYCSEIPFDDPRELGARNTRDEIVYYLEGFVDAFRDFLED